MRKYLGALLATALALPPVSTLADVKPPPSMLADASNAELPAARNNLGVPTNWIQQYHQNGGGTTSGHNLGWGDQNYDIFADHIGAQTQDASQLTTAVLGGSITVGDQIGWQIGTAHTYITVASGDTATTLLNKLAAALQGGALSATIASGATGGYSNNDIVSLTGLGSNCPTAPSFKLTVASGRVTAATVTGSGGSSIMGGYCTATPTGPFAVTGGTGAGLTLNVAFAGPAIANAMLAIQDANGIGYAATAFNQGSNIAFDFPWSGLLLSCAAGGTGSGCPGTPSETITLTPGTLDNGPFGYMSRLVPGRLPAAGDALGAYFMDGQSTANGGIDTQYATLSSRVLAQSASNPQGELLLSTADATSGKTALPKMYIGNGVTFANASDVNCSYQGLGNVQFCGQIFQNYGTTPQQYLIATGTANLQVIWDTAASQHGTALVLRDGGANLWQLGNSYAGGDMFTIFDFVRGASVLQANSNGTLQLMTGGGGVQIGSPSGGDEGAGTLNLAGGALYSNGTAPTGGGAYVRASSPALAGAPTAPTASPGTDTTQIATTAFVLANGMTAAASNAQLPAAQTNLGLRAQLTGNITLFTNAGTGSDSNDCTAATTSGGHGPCATIGHTVATAYAGYDLRNNAITISVAAGTYNEQVLAASPVVGQNEFLIVGAGSGSVTVTAPSGEYAFYAKDWEGINISGMTLGCASGASGEILAAQFGVVDVGSDVKFAACAGATQANAFQMGSVNFPGGVTLTGSAASFAGAVHEGYINFSGSTVAIPSALAYTTFIQAAYGGNISNLPTFTGSGVAGTTGTKYNLGTCGVVQSNGTDLNTLLPGNANGTMSYCTGVDYASQAPVSTSGTIATSNTTAATSPTSGSSVFGGGIGVAGMIWGGASANIAGTIEASGASAKVAFDDQNLGGSQGSWTRVNSVNILYDTQYGIQLEYEHGLQTFGNANTAPTGGDEGPGTLNLYGLLYNNGTAPTGSGGGYVLATSPTLTTPNIGAATATTIAGQKALQATKTGNYSVQTGDSNTSFDNTGATGAVTFTLPSYAAGLRYCFMVTAAQTLEVLAPASNHIAIGTSNSASAGNIQANAPYSTACVVATSVNNQWAAMSTTGSWTVN